MVCDLSVLCLCRQALRLQSVLQPGCRLPVCGPPLLQHGCFFHLSSSSSQPSCDGPWEEGGRGGGQAATHTPLGAARAHLHTRSVLESTAVGLVVVMVVCCVCGGGGDLWKIASSLLEF